MTNTKKQQQNRANYLANIEVRRAKAKERSKLRREKEKIEREKKKAESMLEFADYFDSPRAGSNCDHGFNQPTNNDSTANGKAEISEPEEKTSSVLKEKPMSENEKSQKTFQRLKLVHNQENSPVSFSVPSYKVQVSDPYQGKISEKKGEKGIPTSETKASGERIQVSDTINYKPLLASGLQYLMVLTALVGATWLVVSENSSRFQIAGASSPYLLALVLEAAILSLSFYTPKIDWSFSTKNELASFLKVSAKLVSAKLVLIVLIGFSLFTSIVSDRVAGVEKITSVSQKAADQTLEAEIATTVALLDDFRKKGESGNIGKTQKSLSELRSRKEKSINSNDVEQLTSAYEHEQYINMATKGIPLLISVVFGHILGGMWRKKNLLEV